MQHDLNPSHPLYQYVLDKVDAEFKMHVASKGADRVEQYLASLLVKFVRTEDLYAINDDSGNPTQSVIEMLGQADVRLTADSFEREREVHKHIGDFILFWTGVAPKSVGAWRALNGLDVKCDYLRQGQESYYLVSTFDHSPYDSDAPLFRQMSELYESLAFVVGQVSRKTGLYPQA